MSRVALRWETDRYAKRPSASASLLGKPPADGVADTMTKVFDRLAKRVSIRRGGRPVSHPSPVETA